jgi:hypothetical protein
LSLFEQSERFGDAARPVQERLRRGDILQAARASAPA